MHLRAIFFLLVAVWVLLIGCSRNSDLITSPDSHNTFENLTDLPVLLSDYSSDGSVSEGYGTLGIFNLTIDNESVNAELTPLRYTALTDVLEIVDITNFLQMAPCTDCARIKSVSLNSDNNMVLSIGIKHPFGPGDPLKPISGQNRGDLHVFNIEGTVISDSTGTVFPALGESTAGFSLVNADGFSGYLDDVLDDIYLTDASVHPYKLHFDNYSDGNYDPSNPMGFASVTDPPPSGKLVMAMGSDYDYQDYVLNIPAESMSFIFAIGCTYAVSAASKSDRFSPEYRIPQHNKKAASEVSVEIISNDLAGGDITSTAQIEIHIVDVSHGVAVGTNIDEMLADSSVDDIFIEVPGVTSIPVVLDGNNPTGGTGHDPLDPLIYNGTITNDAGGSEGVYAGLIKVSDSYLPGQNAAPLLWGKDGIMRVSPIENPLTGLFDISEFATWSVFNIDVALGNDPPVAILEPDPAGCDMGETIDFDGTNSFDIDGTITNYEFDFDWDGVEANFTADVSNTTGLATSFPYPTAGILTAGLRVTDDLLEVAYDSATVTVAELDVVYVDDSNTSGIEDGTMANPYNTIPEGLNAATSGYYVWVDDSGNDYTGPITTKSNVILKSVNWDSTDGGDMAAIHRTGSGAVVSMAEDSTIDGFKCYGSSTAGFSVSYDNAKVLNCWITEIGVIYGSNIVEGMRISYCDGVIIDNCEFSNIQLNSSSGILDCIYLMGPTNVTITRCEIHDFDRNTDSGILIPVYFNTVDGIEFHNNLIYDIDSYDNGINIAVYWNTSINSNVTNNVITNIGNSAITGGMYVGTESTGFVGKNNIIVELSGNAITNGAPDLVWDYNDIYNTSGSHPPGTGNITEDPLFVNPGTDFHLDTGSPCIDTGDPTIFDPDSSRSDMGCYGGPLGDW